MMIMIIITQLFPNPPPNPPPNPRPIVFPPSLILKSAFSLMQYMNLVFFLSHTLQHVPSVSREIIKKCRRPQKRTVTG